MSRDVTSAPTINDAMRQIAQTLCMTREKLLATRRAISGPVPNASNGDLSKEPYLFETMGEIGRLVQEIDEIAGAIASDFGAGECPIDMPASQARTTSSFGY